MSFEDVNAKIKHCRKCRLWKDARNAVPGEGPTHSTLMLVGQNPGAEEDKIGRPFVGRAGKFLDRVLAENGIDRNGVFVTNIVKHVTPQNRKPYPDEVEACVPYLVKQIKSLKPRIVVLMGKVAEQTPRLEGVEYMVTIHPSAAMRFTKMRLRFIEDFSELKKRL